MNQQPDELFRRKLAGYGRPAPANAWQKIEAAQRKKNNKALWLKIAASLVVPAMIGAGVWYASNNDNTSAKPVATTTAPQAQPSPSPKVTAPETTTAVPENSTTQQTPATQQHVATNAPARKKSSVRKVATTSTTTPAHDETQNNHTVDSHTVATTNDATVTPHIINTPTATVVADVQPTDAHTKGNTFTYSAAEADKYLDKKAVADATSGEKKSSTFKKLLQKAGDLKNNQDPVGELRQMKNEILALNFKNDKQRGQNK